jgi:hypothetical protein
VRPYRKTHRPPAEIEVEENDTALLIRAVAADGTPLAVAVRRPSVREASIGSWRFRHFALAQRGSGQWLLGKP